MTTTSVVMAKAGRAITVTKQAAYARAAAIVRTVASPLVEAFFMLELCVQFLKGEYAREGKHVIKKELVHERFSERVVVENGEILIRRQICRVYAIRGRNRRVFAYGHMYRKPTEEDLQQRDIQNQIEALR